MIFFEFPDIHVEQGLVSGKLGLLREINHSSYNYYTFLHLADKAYYVNDNKLKFIKDKINGVEVGHASFISDDELTMLILKAIML